MKNAQNLLLISILATILLSCEKDKVSVPEVHAATTQEFKLHIHNIIGNQEVNYDSVFSDGNGRSFTVADFRYYISNIVLIKNDGSELPVTGKVFLVNPFEDNYSVGVFPVGQYRGIKFMLGLDSATNHSNITQYAADNPLAVQNPTMHWSWNSGYLFMKYEGYVDTSIAANGSRNVEFNYHIGLDQYAALIDFSSNSFSISADQPKELLIKCDMRKLLNNINMRTEYFTHSMGSGGPLAQRVVNNYSIAFTAE